MAVTQSTKTALVLRLYAVGRSETEAFVNGIYDSWNLAVLEQLATGGDVYSTTIEIPFDQIKVQTPSK